MYRTFRYFLSKSIKDSIFISKIPSFCSLHGFPTSSLPSEVMFPLNPLFPMQSQIEKRVGNYRTMTTSEPGDYSKVLDEINLKFAEAREEIEAAMESKETVYFNEEAECAREAVKDVLDMFDELLERLPEKDRSALHRSMGLKMEQLKAELKQLDD